MNTALNKGKIIQLLLIVTAAGTLTNGIWMLLFPLNWFHNLPAMVPEFGMFNVHFVRDMGSAFFVIGLALWWGIQQPKYRFVVTTIAAFFYSMHGIIHIYDTARGHVEAHHWWVDFPTSYLPAIVLIITARYYYQLDKLNGQA